MQEAEFVSKFMNFTSIPIYPVNASIFEIARMKIPDFITIDEYHALTYVAGIPVEGKVAFVISFIVLTPYARGKKSKMVPLPMNR